MVCGEALVTTDFIAPHFYIEDSLRNGILDPEIPSKVRLHIEQSTASDNDHEGKKMEKDEEHLVGWKEQLKALVHALHMISFSR